MSAVHHVVLAGATGVVGRQVLQQLLARADVASVVAVGRRPLRQTDPRLVSRVADLQDVTALAHAVPEGVTVALCCLGTTIKQAGTKAAFQALDRDAVAQFARVARQRGATRFLLVSSLGADPQSRNFYLRTKGEAEERVRQVGFAQLTVVRPSLIDDQGTRAETRAGERLMLPVARAVFAVIGRRRRYAPVRASVLGRALVQLAFDAITERCRVVPSEQLHALGG